jgi:hypothetical protein
MPFSTIISQISVTDEIRVSLDYSPIQNFRVSSDTLLVGLTQDIVSSTLPLDGDSIYVQSSTATTESSESGVGSHDTLFVGGVLPFFSLTFQEGSFPLEKRVKVVPTIASKKIFWS